MSTAPEIDECERRLSGLGNFNRVDLGKKLAGKVASAGASISGTSEGLNGRASPKDLETMFQLVYLDFTAPRYDPAAYEAFKAQADQYLANRGVDPASSRRPPTYACP